MTTDLLAMPFSMGRNLLCIFSKKHVDNPPELKSTKQRRDLAARQPRGSREMAERRPRDGREAAERRPRDSPEAAERQLEARLASGAPRHVALAPLPQAQPDIILHLLYYYHPGTTGW